MIQALFVALTLFFLTASYVMIDRMGSVGFGSIEPNPIEPILSIMV